MRGAPRPIDKSLTTEAVWENIILSGQFAMSDVELEVICLRDNIAENHDAPVQAR